MAQTMVRMPRSFFMMVDQDSPDRTTPVGDYSKASQNFSTAVPIGVMISHGGKFFRRRSCHRPSNHEFTMNDSTDNHPNAAETAPEAPRYTSFSGAFQSARTDASSMAKEAAPKLKQAFAGAAHDLAYGAAFSACFAACFAKELIPSSIKETIRRGANAGKQAAEKAAETPAAAEMPPPLGA